MEQTASKLTRTVVDQVVGIIRDGIMDGRFAPGQRLVEADMTEQLGVSRGPLREALRRLSADGLVEIQPYRGAAVRRPSRDDLDELFRIRSALEGLAARLAAERIGDAGRRARAEAAREAMRAGPPSDDLMDHAEDNARFHALIFDLAHSDTLGRMALQVQLPPYRLAFFRLSDAAMRRRSSDQHTAILEAILRADGEAAEVEMRRHIDDTAELARRLPGSLFRG